MPKAPRVTSALGHLDVIRCVDYSPDGRAFATGGCDHAVCLWDGVTGRCFRVMEGHSGVVRALRFSPNGARLASGRNRWHPCVLLSFDSRPE
ncbi:hypothetical protein KKB55_09730 [Myxococcota bacterium]|nr:hypothetical protein [Myxococcota bacterium]MBU1898013.1 hypothetical protein [Myxococcota bacterium]